MKLQENYPLQANNTLALKQHARYFCCANNEDELLQQVHFARQKNISVLMLGEGSNIVLGKDFPGLVIQNAIKGIHVVSEDAESVVLDIGAGENWHALVCHTLHHQWFGLENLALIPGTVGAAPVQNIGAYGVEVCSFVTHVKVLDTETDQWETIDNAHCQFSYRDSVFKHEPGRLLITRVRLRLHKKPRVNVQYQAIKNWFTAQGIVDEKNISPQQVCDAVIAIRRSRLPDPVRMPNAGSFFKNPVIPMSQYQALLKQFPDMVSYPAGDSHRKLAAAWLIDHAGWKGVQEGHVAVHDQQALVLVNRGGATGIELLTFAGKINTDVKKRYGIDLEIEPTLI